MSQKEKLVARFRTIPNDFTWDEMKRMLRGFGYEPEEGEGSRVHFIDGAELKISLHRPHPGNIVKKYVLRQVDDRLMEHDKYGR